ncbi:putative ABC transporter permease [Clostridium sp. MSJ-8]|uniref:putative ABC transporter permease n=1 Tax=Clostridium sp. MSJ-8 TaxID=2841510 RepID=UPI001C0EBCA0|nr:putative ABC transporter permease [Clostridium sp. MSJ-8]MBU5486760.1 putative ABC transporter permease [Clostridium sp. MSJ-8]
MNWLLYVIFNFILYSFFGWIIEHSYSLVTTGNFKDAGFLSIPFKPMYGLAMCILIYCRYKLNISNGFFILLCILIPTAVEYISGFVLKRYFNEIYWNYKHIPFNFNGLICIRFSIYWSILSYIVVSFVQPIIMRVYNRNVVLLEVISVILLLYILFSFVHKLNNTDFEMVRRVNNSKIHYKYRQ